MGNHFELQNPEIRESPILRQTQVHWETHDMLQKWLRDPAESLQDLRPFELSAKSG
jgi:hypothetical protein